ncbi:MAG: SUF system NifU family Fe-S cluster assembly protein [Candidatus Latescibacterota bacterium]|nr:MAG: SUF system NifU family Fe-S cluster assembly protein [Candidatus Latescibacterota bacterium]
MDELRDLYQEMLLDHHKHPRNYGKLENANRKAEGYNPLCGDKVTIYLLLHDDVIEDIAFEGVGCAICKASCSVMTEVLKGRPEAEAEKLFGEFHDLVTSDPDSMVDTDGLGKLAIFAGVREFPMRIKCATLAWHTMRAALRQSDDVVTTE